MKNKTILENQTYLKFHIPTPVLTLLLGLSNRYRTHLHPIHLEVPKPLPPISTHASMIYAQ